MIQYLLEILVFQLAFLFVYDLFLKRETFFQWNRVYLLSTFLMSLALPWVKLEALRTTVATEYAVLPQRFFQLEGISVGQVVKETLFWASLFWYEWFFLAGVVITMALFITKLGKIWSLKQKGEKQYCSDYTKVILLKSELAFSFFKNVFLGDTIPKEKEDSILAHELVHIKQWHSLDLLFFEMMRIAFWFNPLVYVYQSRMSELHEFIADAQVAKTNKKQHYQGLLSEVFQTQNISFINQFFKKSLIKKRIVMLGKSKSKKVLQLKYLLLLPLVLGMLIYTSCEVENKKENIELTNSQTNLKFEVPFAIVDQVPIFPGCENATDKKACFQESMIKHIKKHFNYPEEAQNQGIQGRVNVVFTISEEGTITNIRKRGPHELLEEEVERIINRLPRMKPGRNDGISVKVPFSIPVTFKLSDSNDIGLQIKKFGERKSDWTPFAKLDEAPIFPGCEGSDDKRSCFLSGIQNHIRKNFNYPKEAQEQGIQGRVAVMFTIDRNGNITNVIKRGPHQLLEDEVERIINRLPKMQPGKQDGKVVSVPFSIPVTFKLD